MVRHDARASRERMQSERIRIGLGLLTPEERSARARKEEAKAQEASRKQALETAKGSSLFEDEA